MPTVTENASIWDGWYDWTKAGEEWSERWGGSVAQWHGTILPRIERFVPTGTILEIAPGYGRWTNYLRTHCDRLIVVDLSERCIRACQERFAGDEHITYYASDGSSLDMIEDGSIDFIFSFDSLVHAEAGVMEEYAREFSRVLGPNGAGFVHHSNSGEYRRYFEAPSFLPGRVLMRLWKARILDEPQWRTLDMTAARFREFCETAGLQCISQELINWSTRRLIDCLSTFVPESSAWAGSSRVVRNPHFMAEADAVKRRSSLYST